MKKGMQSTSFIIFELLTPLNTLGEIKYISRINILNFILHFKMRLLDNLKITPMACVCISHYI